MICLCLSFLILLGVTTGCSQKEINQFIQYDLVGKVENLDPQTASDIASLNVIHNIFEGLFSLDNEGMPVPALAESVQKSENGLSYEIQIKQSSVWIYDDIYGKRQTKPVTASDFVFAFRRLLRPNTGSPAAAQFYSIKNAAAVHTGKLSEEELGVTALSESLLRFELEYRNDYFLNLLASTYAMPCNEDFFQSTMGKYGLNDAMLISNGPFEMQAWNHGESIKLIKNQDFREKEKVFPDGVHFWLNSDSVNEQSTPDRLLEGVIDAGIVRGQDIVKIEGKGYQTEGMENAVWGLYLNQSNGNLANRNIRRAIVYAFDRDVYEGSLPSYLKTAKGAIPHSVMFLGRNFREEAGEEIAEQFNAMTAYEYYKTGLSELSKKSITGMKLLIEEDANQKFSEHFNSVSQVLQRELSLFINIEVVDSSEFQKRLASGNFDMAFYRLVAQDNTPISILSQFMSNSGKNFISYQNPELDSLLKSQTLTDQGAGTALLENYKKAEKIILEDGAFIPMLYSTDYFVTLPNVSGVNYNRQSGLTGFQGAEKKQ